MQQAPQRREYIRATPSWRGGANRYDCVFINSNSELDGMCGLDVTHLLTFFSFSYNAQEYQCAPIHWFSKIGTGPDETIGLWMDDDPHIDIVHVDCIYRPSGSCLRNKPIHFSIPHNARHAWYIFSFLYQQICWLSRVRDRILSPNIFLKNSYHILVNVMGHVALSRWILLFPTLQPHSRRPPPYQLHRQSLLLRTPDPNLDVRKLFQNPPLRCRLQIRQQIVGPKARFLWDLRPCGCRVGPLQNEDGLRIRFEAKAWAW